MWQLILVFQQQLSIFTNCFQANVPVFPEQQDGWKNYDEVAALWQMKKKQTFISSSNLSLGVNIFLRVNRIFGFKSCQKNSIV
jgi:hypothetical protein